MHWFIDPIKNHYADFEGRIGRQEYWMFVLCYFILSFVLEIISLDVLILVMQLAMIIPCTAMGARRLHDIGKSGWWQLLALIPIIGWIILIVWCATKTEPIDNMYGAPAVPKTGPEGAAPVAATAAVTAPVVAESAPADATEKAPEQHS